MIVTIDGPAGAGKSSIARELARRLGFEFLDTGAMYRAVALAGLDAGILSNKPEISSETQVSSVGKVLSEIAARIVIEFKGDRIFLDGRDISDEIRTQRVTDHVKHAASNPKIREQLVHHQRHIGDSCDNLVTEGRDQGTIVFPNAACKIFLTATAEERARRRYRQMIANGAKITFAEVLNSQNKRDADDSDRDVGPLAKADDAIEVLTDEMTVDQVLTHLKWVVDSCR